MTVLHLLTYIVLLCVVCLQDLVHYPIPHPYPRKAVRVHHGMTKPYSFLKVGHR